MNKTKHYWTAHEIKKLAKLWTSMDIDEICDELGMDRKQVLYMANQIRKEFPELMPKKHKTGYIRNLIREALG